MSSGDSRQALDVMAIFSGACALGLLVAVSLPASVAAHGILLDSIPRAGETVPVPVLRLDLRFNARIELGLSRLRLTGPSGEDVPFPDGWPKAGGPGQLWASLPPLAPGVYMVHWQIFTGDGHLGHGRFSFRVGDQDP